MTSFRNWVDIEHSSVSKNFKYVWKPNIRPFWLPHKLANWYVHFQEAKPQSLSNWCFWNTEFYYIFAQMVHTTLVPNLLRKATRSMTIKISEKKNGTTTGSTKSLSITPKASPTSTPDQCIINVSLHKSTCQKYWYCQTRWKEYCAEKNISTN